MKFIFELDGWELSLIVGALVGGGVLIPSPLTDRIRKNQKEKEDEMEDKTLVEKDLGKFISIGADIEGAKVVGKISIDGIALAEAAGVWIKSKIPGAWDDSLIDLGVAGLKAYFAKKQEAPAQEAPVEVKPAV